MATRPDGTASSALPMDAHLKLLADASLETAAAEAALNHAAHLTAVERLDGATAALAELRTAWTGFNAAERSVVGPAAADLRRRIDAARTRVPRMTALTVGTPVSDPEEELEPAD